MPAKVGSVFPIQPNAFDLRELVFITQVLVEGQDGSISFNEVECLLELLALFGEKLVSFGGGGWGFGVFGRVHTLVCDAEGVLGERVVIEGIDLVAVTERFHVVHGAVVVHRDLFEAGEDCSGLHFVGKEVTVFGGIVFEND